MGLLISKLKRSNVNILIHGLDAAGKTTILYRLKLGEVVTTIPTIGLNVETVSYKQTTLSAIDVGGRCSIRPLYRHYYQNTDAIVFVVDSYDRSRMSEVKDEVERVLREEFLKDAVFLVLANKQDLPGAMTVQEMADSLDIGRMSRSHRMHVHGCSALTGDGLYECFDWLTRELSRSPGGHSAEEPGTANKDSQDKPSWSTYIKKALVTLQTVLPKLN